jgi:hypothetical protein
MSPRWSARKDQARSTNYEGVRRPDPPGGHEVSDSSRAAVKVVAAVVLTLALGLALAMGLAACGGGDSTEATIGVTSTVAEVTTTASEVTTTTAEEVATPEVGGAVDEALLGVWVDVEGDVSMEFKGDGTMILVEGSSTLECEYQTSDGMLTTWVEGHPDDTSTKPYEVGSDHFTQWGLEGTDPYTMYRPGASD